MRFACSLLMALAVNQPCIAKNLPNYGGKQRVESLGAQHKAVFRRYVSIWERGTLDELEGVLTANYVGHAASGTRDLDGLRDRINQFHKLYLNPHFVIHDQVAEDDRVATRMTATATSSATGKPVKLVGLNVSRFHENRIAEEWPVWETAP